MLCVCLCYVRQCAVYACELSRRCVGCDVCVRDVLCDVCEVSGCGLMCCGCDELGREFACVLIGCSCVYVDMLPCDVFQCECVWLWLSVCARCAHACARASASALPPKRRAHKQHGDAPLNTHAHILRMAKTMPALVVNFIINKLFVHQQASSCTPIRSSPPRLLTISSG